jgi:hypothetical protein
LSVAGAGINTVSASGSTVTVTGTEVDGSVSNEIQQIDTFSLSGQTLRASLSSDGAAAKTVTLPVVGITAGTNVTVSSTGGNFTINASGGSGSPEGSTGQVQYNNAGVFGASSNLFWDATNSRLGVGTSSPSARIQSNGSGATSSTFSFVARNSSQDVLSIRDDNYIVGGNQSAMTLSSNNNTIRLSCPNGNPSTLVGMSFYPESASSNLGTGLYVIPKGTGYSSGIKSQFVVMNTDFIADPVNYEFMAIRAAGNAFTLATGGVNAGTLRPLLFSSGFADGITNPNQFWLFTNGNIGINVASSTARIDVRSAGNSSATDIVNFENSDGNDILRIRSDGKNTYWATNTASGTTSVQTINRPSGTINIAAGESSKVVNNSLCTTSSIVLPVMRTNDATALIDSVVPGNGSFTIYLTAAAAAEISVGFFIIN